MLLRVSCFVLSFTAIANAAPKLSREAATAEWKAVIDALANGSDAAVKERTTARGYKQLLVYLASDQRTQEFFIERAAVFRRLEVHWTELDGDRCRGRLGAKMKGSPIELKLEAGRWKLDYWGGPGR